MMSIRRGPAGASKVYYYAQIGVLSGLAAVCMMFDMPVLLMPEFLKLDFSDIPALVGAFALGPAAGVLVELVKNVLHLFATRTAGIGELANFLVGAFLVWPAGMIYQRIHSRRGAILGLAAGTLTMTLAAALCNYYVLLPLYEWVLKFSINQIVMISHAANARIVDGKSLIVFAIVPFNLIKGVVIAAVMLLIYKRVEPLLIWRR